MGRASFLASIPKTQNQNHFKFFKAVFHRLLQQRVDVTQLALPRVHGWGGQKLKVCVDLRANLISTKVSRSQCKFSVVVYLRARLSRALETGRTLEFYFAFFFRDKAVERSYLLMNLSTINSRQKLPDNCKVMFRYLLSG